MEPPLLTLIQTRLGLRNSTTRLPFRYGKACLTRCPQAVLGATIEIAGEQVEGYAGDCFPPGWFDKSGGTFAEQIDDMLSVISLAEEAFAQAAHEPTTLFAAWLDTHREVHERSALRGFTPLLASFGVSMVERAMLDALCRARGVSFFAALRENLPGIAAAQVHPELAGLQPVDWLPSRPLTSIHVRHTVGLADPLTASDIPPEERRDDGLPQALEEYIRQTGTRYFKVKVSGELDRDLERLTAIASLAENYLESDYRLTLDGNEQFRSAEEFDAIIEAVRGEPRLQTLLANVLAVEQPLERSIALDAAHTAGIQRLGQRGLGQRVPVIIDESDGTLDAYPQAIDLGYRGVSSKNCKGPIKSVLNAGLTWLRNDRGRRQGYLMTGDDLFSVGIIPVQADLCLAAAFGLTHVERNGHHYHPGLSYLPRQQQQAALAAHADMYGQTGSVIGPRVMQGRLEIGSLQCAGFGFAVLPDFTSMQSPEQWDYASLGLE